MKKKFLIPVSALIVLALFLGACSTDTTSDQQADTNIISTVVQDSRIIVDGNLVPKDSLYLKFQSSGEIEEILVEEGDQVSAGTALARISGSESIQADLEAVYADLLDAEQQMDDLYEYADTEKSTAYQELLDARAAYNLAEETYDDFDEDLYQDDLDAAKIDVSEAQKDVEDAEEELQDYIDLDEENTTRESYETELENAQDDERQEERDQVELEISFGQVNLDLETAEARLTLAESEYEKVKNGPDSDSLELLEAKISSAEAQQTALEKALDNLTLKAAFDGTIAEIRVSENEFITAGTSVILLADFSEWYVETSDLTEMDVIHVQEGQTVSVEPDAYPDMDSTLSGTVERIDIFSETKQGDVTYTARILMDDFDLNLSWGMTVTVYFEE